MQFDDTNATLLFCAPLPGEECVNFGSQLQFHDDAHDGYFISSRDSTTGKPQDRFYLLGATWTVVGSSDVCTGSIQYDHRLFDAVDSSCHAYLAIEKGALERAQQSRRVLPGKTLQ
jgi:hypothetical protein